jgi:hypothetical protein
MASHLMNDPEHWRERAKAMRILSAEAAVDPASKRTMLKIADEYEFLAHRAEERIAPKEHRQTEQALGEESQA